MGQEYVLEVTNLRQHFSLGRHHTIKAVDDVSFRVKKGEIFGLVGETGCGKSTIARTIMGMYRASAGDIVFNGMRVSDKRNYKQNRNEIQKKMQIIFQDSAAALDPRMTVEALIGEPMVIHKVHDSKEKLRKEVLDLMDQVGLDASYSGKYPDEISGGQRQRVAIARAISLKPELVIADEPIASLDVSIQAQIINLFLHLQEKHGFSFLFIAHDLSIIRFICDRIAVMKRGKIIETAPTEELFTNPVHPYTKSLLDVVPVPDPIYERQKKIDEYCEDNYMEQDAMKAVNKMHIVRQYI